MSKIPYTKEQLEKLCQESFCYNEILTKTGRVKGGTNRQILKKYIELYNIDISHFTNSTSPKGKRIKQSQKDLPLTKFCLQCNTEKDTYKDFYWSNGKTRNICKECVRNKEKEHYQDCVQRLTELKQTLSCQKCHENRYYLLEFHHRDPSLKNFEISEKIKLPLDKIQEEIEKCDVLCANCHREWHYLEKQNNNLNYTDWLNQ